MVLDVRNLRIHYDTAGGSVPALNGVSFQVKKGEIVGLVGESGCGKTTAAMGILRLIQSPGRILEGEVFLNGDNLMSLDEKQFRKKRWRELSLIPQGAMNSLNPVMKIRKQIADAVITHEGRQPKKKLKERILDTFNLVGLPPRVYSQYPHELSGGMKQRVCIAMAVILHPSLIIADEPTSALDVVVQRLVAQTLLNVKSRMGVSMLMIGHDMGLQAQMVDRMIVMYAGNIVEIAPVETAFRMPCHPYTQLLIDSIPSIKMRKALKPAAGITHDWSDPPPGCSFQVRCPKAMDTCMKEVPPPRMMAQDHMVACHLYPDENRGT
jgi:peptide/nickel transport system ATP-binding protein